MTTIICFTAFQLPKNYHISKVFVSSSIKLQRNLLQITNNINKAKSLKTLKVNVWVTNFQLFKLGKHCQ